MSDELSISERLFQLTKQKSGFIRNVRLAENALAGYSFANGWVTCPPFVGSPPREDLPALDVSGHARTGPRALELLLMEAVERHCTVFSGSERLRKGTARELDAQNRFRSCHPDSPRYWAPATNLRDSSQLWVPAAQTYLGYVMDDEEPELPASSNGCASGRALEDAISRAVLELVERDALAVWWYNRIQRPELKFAACPELDAIRTALKHEDRELTLLNITHDLRIPVVVAFTADLNGKRIYFGSAADLTFSQAAVRAASEMLQFWFWGRVSDDPPARKRWLETESLTTQSWLTPASEQIAPMHDIPLQGFLSTIDPLVVNLTRDNIKIPVIRAVIPSLIDHRQPAVSPRLLQLPVDLGWRKKQMAPAELMQRPCPI